MAHKVTQTSLSSHNRSESARDSASLWTLYDDGDSYDVGDVLERNESFAGRQLEDSHKKESIIVDWDGPDDPVWDSLSLGLHMKLIHRNDQERPRNFPRWRKWVITLMLGIMTMCVTFASSVFSTAIRVTAKKFGVSQEVMVLAVSLFVLGFAFGPIIFGPLSELYGRKRPLFLGMFIFGIFQIPCAVAQNLQTIFICRFLGGVFASAPLAIVSLVSQSPRPVCTLPF